RINTRCRHPDVWVDGPIDYDRRWICEHRQQFLKKKVWTLHVRVERSVERRCVPLADWFQFGNSGIDEEDVQHSKRLADFLGNLAVVRRFSRVGLDHDYIAQFLASRIQTCLVETSNRDSRSFLQESASSFESDSASTAGDQSAFSLESWHE